MAPPQQLSNLREAIVRSGLLPDEMLEPYFREPSDQDAILTKLLNDRLLTRLQAGYIRAGKTRVFFINSKYKLLDPLGAGGMGRVYLCEHLILQKLVAVKILQQGLKKGNSDAESTLARFYREARAVALLDHPNIVKMYDVDRIGDNPYMVIEYVDGVSLHSLVTKNGPLGSQQVANYLRQAAAGLQHAHQRGLIHRDIKPGNILLSRDGIVKLLDLGLARFSQDESQNNGITAQFDANSIIGTIDFMAPEQADTTQTTDIRADIYSLGCTCYFLASGRLPFSGTVTQKLYGHKMLAPEPLSVRIQHLPSTLLETIERMMEKSPEDRFQTPQEIIDSLGDYGKQIPLPDKRDMPPLSANDYRLGLAKNSEMGSVSTPKPSLQSETVALRPKKGSSTKTQKPLDKPNRKYPRWLLAIPLVGMIGLIIALVMLLNQPKTLEVKNDFPTPNIPIDPKPKETPKTIPSTGKIVRGGGSTFVNTPMSHWAKLYENNHGIKIDYTAVGSGKGIQGLKDNIFAFGCSDVCLTDTQIDEIQKSGQDVIHIPLVMGAVVVTQNLPDIQAPLKYTGPVLADIYSGKITRWNAEPLKILNPGVDLPDTPITVVRRADSSGTSYIWTDYLSKASAQWEAQVGRGTMVKWPVGESGNGNNGVANLVTRKVGAIGYVELTYALENNLKVGLIKNREGKFVAPTLENVTAAAESSLHTIPDDLRYTLTDATGEKSYPLSGTAWAILHVDQSKNPQASELVAFLKWAIHDGQAYLKDLRFAPLPIDLVKRSHDKLDSIQVTKKSK